MLHIHTYFIESTDLECYTYQPRSFGSHLVTLYEDIRYIFMF